jgi:hypothetical protein
MRSKSLAGLCALVAVAACALLLPAASPAAETQASSFKKIPVTGTAANGKKFAGTYTVQRFAKQGGKVVAIGRLAGKIGNKSVSKGGVAMPVRVNGGDSGALASATCGILDLTLGPLDLKLLGLRVQLNQVHLQITAESGPGNLLGNLLCSITNLLNQPAALPLNQLVGLLNIVLQLVNTPALGGLTAPTPV